MPTEIITPTGYLYPAYKTDLYIIGETLKKMKRGYSPMFLICGKQRAGKSFIALWLAHTIMKLLHKKKFDVKTNVFFDPFETIKALEKIEKEPVIIDEAGVLLGNREWWDKFHIAFDKIIQTQGYKCNCYIFVLPFAIDLDKKFRKHIDYQIIMRRRGYFSVFEFIKKYGELKQEVKAFKRILKENIIVKKRQLPNDVWIEYESMVMDLKEVIRKQEVIKMGKIRDKDAWNPFIKRGVN